MKKTLLIALAVATGVTNTQDSRWNRFKGRFGFGQSPQRDELTYTSTNKKFPNHYTMGSIKGINDNLDNLSHRTATFASGEETPFNTMDWSIHRSNRNLARQLKGYGQELGRHQGRYEGFRDTALVGAAIAGTAAAGYGLYWAYNKYMVKDLKRIENELERITKMSKNLSATIEKALSNTNATENDKKMLTIYQTANAACTQAFTTMEESIEKHNKNTQK